MLFNSTRFLIFLPCVLLVVGVLPRTWRNYFLLAVSYFFYGCWDWRFLGLLIGTTIIDFWVGKHIAASDDPRLRQRTLMLSLAANLTVLGVFKYYNFFILSAVRVLEALGMHASVPVLSVILPVGISFYTFQSISYTVDVYRRTTTAVENFWDFALYVAYFPQLVAGPISRKADLLPKIIAPARLTPQRINTALCLLILGFTKKVLIADMLSPQVDAIFSHPGAMDSGQLLRGAYFFAFQIYCDFSGYTDIARGVSELFGITLVINFNQPYLSSSITEFWRRWHMSLSSWLRDYLYIPLGGNRYGAGKTYRNLMLTMLIGGLWHGANWTFVVWGGIHGVLLAVERALGIGKGERLPEPGVGGWLRRAGLTVLTFQFVVLAWVFFRAPDIGTALQFLAGICRGTGLTSFGVAPFLVAAAVLAFDVPQNIWGKHTVFMRIPWWIRSPMYSGLCLAVLARLMYGGNELPFIYFQF